MGLIFLFKAVSSINWSWVVQGGCSDDSPCDRFVNAALLWVRGGPGVTFVHTTLKELLLSIFNVLFHYKKPTQYSVNVENVGWWGGVGKDNQWEGWE